MSEWIPVSERLPPEETRVLAYDGTDVFDSEYMTLAFVPNVIRQQLLKLRDLQLQLVDAVLQVVDVLQLSLQPFAHVGQTALPQEIVYLRWRHHAGTSSITDIRSSSISNNSAAWSSA